jgi:hypothetical protein
VSGFDAPQARQVTRRIIPAGDFLGPSLRHVLDWEELHRDELMANWARAREQLPLLSIDPLT